MGGYDCFLKLATKAQNSQKLDIHYLPPVTPASILLLMPITSIKLTEAIHLKRRNGDGLGT